MTVTTGEVTKLNIGDSTLVGNVLCNIILEAIITDVNNPNMFGATLQAFQSQALLTIAALQGIQGNPGQPSFALQFQNQILADVSHLPGGTADDAPAELTDLPADLGKYWIFNVTDEDGNVQAAVMQVWYGTVLGYQEFPVGSPGPTGPFPVITPEIVLMEPGNASGPNGVDSWIQVTGTISNPTYTFFIAAPAGPVGPTGTLHSCPDIDLLTNPPAVGDTLTCSSRVTPGTPTGLSILPSSSGGTLGAGNWFYQVCAIVGTGQMSLPSNEVEAELIGSTNSVALSWFEPGGAGATGYIIFRGRQATEISEIVGTISDPTITAFTDTGIAGTPGSPPSAGIIGGRSIWVPSSPQIILPKFYTIPVSAFQAAEGLGADTTPVATFALPQQPWPWKPWVVGQMKIFGLSISTTPLQVGAQVFLGSATGTLVASGEGNSLGAVSLVPNAASGNRTNQAITPTNNVGMVPAMHQGQAGTLFFCLVSQGMAGLYDYDPTGSTAGVLVVPCPNGPTT